MSLATPADAAEMLEGSSAEEIIRWTYATHRRVAIVASFQAESSVLIDMVSKLVEAPEVVTLDTGRLPEETHQVMDAMRARYGLRLHVQSPAPEAVAALVAESGPFGFQQSVENRHACCEVRKTVPLKAALAGFDAWITGLRREQGPTRAATPIVAADRAHGGIAKIAPLVSWTRDSVWSYIEEHDVPVHPLYRQGYTSIGCAPCTRATRPGEDERAGRWWWESAGEVKECGIHWAAEVAR